MIELTPTQFLHRDVVQKLIKGLLDLHWFHEERLAIRRPLGYGIRVSSTPLDVISQHLYVDIPTVLTTVTHPSLSRLEILDATKQIRRKQTRKESRPH